MPTSTQATGSANKVSSLKQLGRVSEARKYKLIEFDREELRSILYVEVQSTANSRNKVAKILFKDNTIVKFLLDFDTHAEAGDRLRKSSIELRQYEGWDNPVLYGKVL